MYSYFFVCGSPFGGKTCEGSRLSILLYFSELPGRGRRAYSVLRRTSGGPVGGTGAATSDSSFGGAAQHRWEGWGPGGGVRGSLSPHFGVVGGASTTVSPNREVVTFLPFRFIFFSVKGQKEEK